MSKFEPTTLSIEIKSQKELENLKCLMSVNVSVPELVKKEFPEFVDKGLLTEQMGEIHNKLRDL